MNPSEENNFEQQWKRILDDASVPPPSAVWDGIEAHLDKDDSKIVPLTWWQNRKVWMVAASLTALLLVGSGVWLNYTPENAVLVSNNTPVGSANTKGKPAQRNKVEQGGSVHPEPEGNANKTIAQENHPDKTPIASTDFGRKGSELAASNRSELNRSNLGETKRLLSPDSETGTITSEQLQQWETIKGVILDNNEANRNRVAQYNIQDQEPENEIVLVQKLTIRPPMEQEVFLQSRYVFFKPKVDYEESEPVVTPKEYWAGVSFMPSTFNPNLQVVSAPQSYQSMAYSSQKAISGNSKAGASYAFQTQGGIKVSKHWSVEMGINFLQGNSMYEGGGYLLNSTATSKSSNVLESALADAAGKATLPLTPASPNSGFTSNNSLYINVNKDISNDYRYLQVPLQAGFTLNPDGKWNYALLGGVMTNLFLRNDLESSNGDIITTKAGDNVYRTLNLAATTGLRIQYKLSEKWRANLTGSYQQGITSGVYSDISLKSKANMYGVAWGVRFSF